MYCTYYNRCVPLMYSYIYQLIRSLDLFPSSHLVAFMHHVSNPPTHPHIPFIGRCCRTSGTTIYLEVAQWLGCRLAQPTTTTPALAQIVIPLLWQTWKLALNNHPNQDFADLVLSGIRNGFRIGFNYSHLSLYN